MKDKQFAALPLSVEKIIEIVRSVKPGAGDLENCADLFEAGVIDSFGIIALVFELNQAFGVNIGVLDLERTNFRTVASIHDLIKRLS